MISIPPVSSEDWDINYTPISIVGFSILCYFVIPCFFTIILTQNSTKIPNFTFFINFRPYHIISNNISTFTQILYSRTNSKKSYYYFLFRLILRNFMDLFNRKSYCFNYSTYRLYYRTTPILSWSRYSRHRKFIKRFICWYYPL